VSMVSGSFEASVSRNRSATGGRGSGFREIYSEIYLRETMRSTRRRRDAESKRMRQRFEMCRKDRPLPHLPRCKDVDAMKVGMVSQ
jgi:hypothetical protein